MPLSVFLRMDDIVCSGNWDDFQSFICFKQIVRAIRVQACGRRPGDDPVLIDVVTTMRGHSCRQDSMDTVRAPPGMGEHHFTC